MNSSLGKGPLLSSIALLLLLSGCSSQEPPTLETRNDHDAEYRSKFACVSISESELSAITPFDSARLWCAAVWSGRALEGRIEQLQSESRYLKEHFNRTVSHNEVESLHRAAAQVCINNATKLSTRFEGKLLKLNDCTEGNLRVSAWEYEQRSRAATEAAASVRYQVNEDGTVLDTKKHRVWLRCSLGQTLESNTCVGSASQLTYKDAIKAIDELNNRPTVQAAGQKWGLPSASELHELVHCSTGMQAPYKEFVLSGGCEGNFQRPTIDIQAFPNTPTDPAFWTQTVSPKTGDRDYVRFYNGISMVTSLDRELNVRPILRAARTQR